MNEKIPLLEIKNLNVSIRNSNIKKFKFDYK